jgi:hypothetical protein
VARARSFVPLAAAAARPPARGGIAHPEEHARADFVGAVDSLDVEADEDRGPSRRLALGSLDFQQERDLGDQSVSAAVPDRCYRLSGRRAESVPYPVPIIGPDSEHGRPVVSVSAGREIQSRPLGAIGDGFEERVAADGEPVG